jgi:hypothetical protein
LTSKNQNLLQKSASLRDILLGSSQAKPPSIGISYIFSFHLCLYSLSF